MLSFWQMLIKERRVSQWLMIISFTIIVLVRDMDCNEIVTLASVMGVATVGLGATEKKE